HTWDDLLPPLAEAGYRAVAPWMRGYPPTEIPADRDFSVAALGRDVLRLADALEAERFTLIGHDWGASTVYQATALSPERVVALVAIAIPPLRALRPSLGALWSLRHFMYYALPLLPERHLRANNYAGVRAICRRWSPGWTIPDDEFAHIVASLDAPGGLESALGYYRTFVRGALSAEAKEVRKAQGRRISVPTLLIYGKDDIAAPFYSDSRALERSFAEGTSWTLCALDGGGHFIHREQPGAVAEAVLPFLAR
ncbi:MAG: alpha/beta hydrolase, partial [Myxococcota bacterium]